MSLRTLACTAEVISRQDWAVLLSSWMERWLAGWNALGGLIDWRTAWLMRELAGWSVTCFVSLLFVVVSSSAELGS